MENKITFLLLMLLAGPLQSHAATAPLTANTVQPGPLAAPRPTAPNSDDLQLVDSVRDQIRAKVWGVPLEKYSITSSFGQVTIQGQAQNATEADRVLTAARATSGVKSVVNAITVPPRF